MLSSTWYLDVRLQRHRSHARLEVEHALQQRHIGWQKEELLQQCSRPEACLAGQKNASCGATQGSSACSVDALTCRGAGLWRRSTCATATCIRKQQKPQMIISIKLTSGPWDRCPASRPGPERWRRRWTAPRSARLAPCAPRCTACATR